jgi:hypothetical protein
MDGRPGMASGADDDPARGTRDGPDSDRFQRLERLAPPRGRGPSGPVVAVVGIVAIVVALLKPWASPEPVATPIAARSVAPRADLITPAPVPTTPTAESAATGLCFGVAEWRVVAAETWSGRPIRAWIAADGRIAHDPLDPNIGFTPVVASSVPSLGFCAPVSGDDRPPADTVVALWRVDEAGATALRPRVREPAVATPFGRLWWPPAAAAADPMSWRAGRYVVGLASGTSEYVRFLGIEVILTPAR